MTERFEWLDWLEASGPFLAVPVLKKNFPQGLEKLDPQKQRHLRQAYDEWREAKETADPDLTELHTAWIDLVLKMGLELDEDDSGDNLKSPGQLPNDLTVQVSEHGVTLIPDYAVVDDQNANKSLMLIQVFDPGIDLNEAVRGDSWASTPSERMIRLCRDTGTRLGLITNGEQWLFVDAPVGGVTSFASWYVHLWSSEPVLLQAFVSLLGIRRFFVAEDEQLPALLDRSLEYQDEVRDTLGEQVRRAVEVLIQALDKADVDRNRELLRDVGVRELYEGGLTVMMRLVFLLSAEERDLLLLGDRRYEANYAISTLRMQLREEDEAILERRWDAWSRLLAVFRGVYGGIDHEALRMPALGGSLFDPDRFTFLEGRAKNTTWQQDPAKPLPIDNRTVLLLLDAIQLYEGRTLSYRALDVEQLGYVYEGLLDHTVNRVEEVTLDLDATKNAKQPWITLGELESAALNGNGAVEKLLTERTGSSSSRVHNDLRKELKSAQDNSLLTACQGDEELFEQVKPYFHLIRLDSWGQPLVYPKNSFVVTRGEDRRQTGSHYTPTSLTEAIVRETLEPIVYVGPAEGKPREEWQLKPPAELLDLKICDPAMGSGAFLVQVCRWLGERLVEAWAVAEQHGQAVTTEGEVIDEVGDRESLSKDSEDRTLTARRLIAERCIYGVDVNPLAVELAKLSIWLITLAKGRPFGFLDHNLRSGDSLLGIHDLNQLLCLHMILEGATPQLFAQNIRQAVTGAMELRKDLRDRPIRDIRDVEFMASLDAEAKRRLDLPILIADAFVGEVLASGKASYDPGTLAMEAGKAIEGDVAQSDALRHRASKSLAVDWPKDKPERKPFHWVLEFPEVFSRSNSGFDATVGNPPFLGGQMISGTLGDAYAKHIITRIPYEHKASVDVVVHFFIKALSLLNPVGYLGLLARRSMSEGDNRKVGLEQMIKSGSEIFLANTDIVWPGKASVVVHQIHFSRDKWRGDRLLNDQSVDTITSRLSEIESWEPKKLAGNSKRMFQGTILLGEGFKITESLANEWLSDNNNFGDILFPFIGGSEVNKNPKYQPSCWVIFFGDWSKRKSQQYVDAFNKVEREVKPQRDKLNNKTPISRKRKKYWWLPGSNTRSMYHAIGRDEHFSSHPSWWSSDKHRMDRVLVISTGVTKYPAFTFLPNNYIYSNKLCVLADDRYSVFALLSSDIHAAWAWQQKTSLGGDLSSLVYAHGHIFETFPFPGALLDGRDEEVVLEIGQSFFEMRQRYMQEHELGLTKFYNEFHDPASSSPALQELRSAQHSINEVVFKLYGWNDLSPASDFREVGYLPDGSNIRFALSGEAHAEVLRRLSELNRQRYEEEAAQGRYDKKKSSQRGAAGDLNSKPAATQHSLDL